MERKKIVGTPFKKADGVNVGYDINVNFDNSNKPLPTGEEIRIVNAAEQFEKERQESTKYRLTGNINPLIYYPQEYYWLGTLINNNFEFVTGTTTTSQTNPLNTQNYDLPNILTVNGPNPETDNFDIMNKDNWVGQILYPFENEYTLKYKIPQFNSNLAFSVDVDDVRFSIDTGIDKLVYDSISNYLDLMNNGTTIEDWFIGSNFIAQAPVEANQTLVIKNQQIQGYPQDGVPFLFSLPVKTEQGWFTALYIPFPHSFEEDDYIFIKPIASTGYLVANTQYDTCDPSLYGFKRVISTQWNSVLNNSSKHYVIIDHKTEYHEDWTLSVAPNSNNWKVLSSQGFIKRVKNYSDVGTILISTENLLNTTFSIISTTEIMVTLTVEHGLKKEDDILLTLSEDAVDTTFENQLRPMLYNLSGTYEVINIVDNFSFTIRTAELSDGIAYYDGQYSVGTLPQTTFITVSKLNSYPSEYYLRKGKILTTINEFEVNNLPMSNSIFNDSNVNLVIEEDVDIKGIKDNLNRPLSQLYLNLTKRAGKENYDFTDVESFFGWMFQYGQILVKTGDGLEIVSKRTKETDNNVGYVKDVTGGWMESYGEFLGDSYFMDLSEYNKSTLQEIKVEGLKHRFNTSYRECGNGICDEYLLEDADIFPNWNYYSLNTSDLNLSTPVGATLTSSNAWTGPNATNNSNGNFIEKTFIVTSDYVGQELYLAFEFAQVTSTGIVKVLDPGGSVITQSLVYPGNSPTINGIAQQGSYSAVFTPSTIGTYTLLLGLSNYPSNYTDLGGNTITTSTFEGKYDNVQIIKFYGTPQYAGWVYDPIQEYKIREFSQFIETADPQVLGIPSYATFIDGLWYWRDLLDIGFFEDIDFTIGVEYPFLNGKHYVDETKDIIVGMTPNRMIGTNIAGGTTGNQTIIFGCMDSTANNYNPFATIPCGSDPLQGGPCHLDINGIMQTLVSNPLGCCCFYQLSPGTSNNTLQDIFAVKTANPGTGLGQGGPSVAGYDYGIQNSGYNKCNGIYPYWDKAWYWSSNYADHPLLDGPWELGYDFYSVSTGVDNPAARFSQETGSAIYDILTFQNYGSTQTTISNVENLLGITLGNGSGGPYNTNVTGQEQVLFDPDNVWISPVGSQAGGNWGSEPNTGGGDNNLSDWSTTETTTYLGTTYTTTNKYFDQTGILEFYKFDTQFCNTCFDKGVQASTGDYFAPRNNWPLLNPLDIATGGDGTGGLKEFTNGNGVTMKIPPLFTTYPSPGKNRGVSWKPVARYERGSGGPGNSNDFSDFTSAGLIERDVLYGSTNTNIAAHRKPTDPDNYRFFYAQCPTTWACNIKPQFGTNSDAFYPGDVNNPGPSVPFNMSYSPVDTTFNSFNGGQCQNSNSSVSDSCSRYCACLVPSGGQKENYAAFDADMLSANLTWNVNFEQNQPSFFQPTIPGGETHYYRFRGRVNIEMGVNHEGFEFYKGQQTAAGWQFAMSPENSFTGGPPLTYLNPTWLPNASTPQTWLQWSQWVAGEMETTGNYKNYTRQYAGFWIAVVSETDKVTYIYDPDDGGNGYSSSSTSKQSDGVSDYSSINWNIGCGGFKQDGVTEAVNKMSYTPCNDYSTGSVNPNCGYTGNGGGDESNPCDGCSSTWNGVNTVFDDGAGSYVAAVMHPRYDRLIAQGNYVPSCGEPGTNTNETNFQKQWSQSFISEEIPLKQGDKVFIYTKTINGEFKTNNKGGTAHPDNIMDANGPILGAYSGSWPDFEYLPSYIVGQLTQVTS
mgnify:CR=1 FL=1